MSTLAGILEMEVKLSNNWPPGTFLDVSVWEDQAPKFVQHSYKLARPTAPASINHISTNSQIFKIDTDCFDSKSMQWACYQDFVYTIHKGAYP